MQQKYVRVKQTSADIVITVPLIKTTGENAAGLLGTLSTRVIRPNGTPLVGYSEAVFTEPFGDGIYVCKFTRGAAVPAFTLDDENNPYILILDSTAADVDSVPIEIWITTATTVSGGGTVPGSPIKKTALDLVNTILRDKMGETGTVLTIENTDDAGVLRVLRALNEIKDELAWGDYDWNCLKKTGDITLETDEDTYLLATDVARVLKTYYLASDFTAIQEPLFTLVSDEEYHYHTAHNTIDGLPYVGREFGVDDNGVKQVQVKYTPTATYNGTKIYYDYIRDVPDFTLDDQINPLPDLLLIEGAYFKLRSWEGSISQEDMTIYVALKQKLMMRDKGPRVVYIPYRDI